MRFSSFAATWIACVMSSSAVAECYVCDEVVEFDAVRAACFMTGFERFSFEADAKGRAEVDLSDCAGGSAVNSRGLDAFPYFPDGTASPADPKLRSVYILDEGALTCLHTILMNRKDPIDPSLQIDLATSCQ